MRNFFKSNKKEVNSTPDITDERFLDYFKSCTAYTMTSKERMYALYQSVNYILDNKIEGDLVECGVWQGGSSILMGLILKDRNALDRKIILYDTFEGMSEPTKDDVDLNGVSAEKQLKEQDIKNENSVWCYSGLEQVRENFKKSGLANLNVEFVKGKVEETIPNTISEKIALLRLDTDWYESTKHEMLHLYPRLTEKGILIIDDYGHWKGCRDAIDEYLKEHQLFPLINRIDYTGRLIIKL